MKTDPQTCAEAGAYFMCGAMSITLPGHNFDKLGGWGGFVSELCLMANYADRMAYAGGSVVEYPGVWGYEVASPYGAWFAQFYKDTGNTPTTDQCKIWLVNETERFFLDGDEPCEALSEALMEVA